MKENKNKACPAVGKCGGCSLINLPYEEQLKRKQKRAEECLASFGKVSPIEGMKESPLHYRNKVHWAFDSDPKGKILAGTYEESTHRIVPLTSCLLEDERADKILCTIRELMPSFHLTAYNERTGRGFLRHVLIRVGKKSGEIMVVLVAATPVFPGKNNFVKVLRERHPEITTILLNLNEKFGSMILGEKETVLYGKGYILDELCGMTFRISSKSFYQINSVQTERLYDAALSEAGLTGKEVVVDAYCGVGTIGILASAKAGQVLGIELNPDAVRDAKGNAKANGRKNINFVCADAGEYLTKVADAGEHADVIIMDPPRTGSTPEFLNSVITCKPNRVVYVSCNPETLARDLKILTAGGYKVKKIRPFDMFPGTEDIETVVTLSRA